MDEFLSKIRSQREKKNLSQVEVVRQVGCSLTAYRLWEAGVSRPTGSRLEKLIEVLDLDDEKTGK